jgi:hypothetical protein
MVRAVVLLTIIASGGCRFGQGKPVLEQINPAVPGSKFKVIATVAGGSGTADIRMSATVRQQLNDSGWTAVRRAGRWENQSAAITEICSDQSADGVLFVWYDRLELDDCSTRKAAYTIEGSAERGVALTGMMERLMKYLRQPGATAPAPPPPPAPEPVPPPPPPPAPSR